MMSKNIFPKDMFPNDNFPKFSFMQALWAYHMTSADFGFFISKRNESAFLFQH